MFGFVYEDSLIEKSMIEKYLIKKDEIFNNEEFKNNFNGLMILSGGCTMFDVCDYFSNSENSELTCVDFNPVQLDIVRNKIKLMDNPIEYNNYISSISTSFDYLFTRIKNGDKFDDVFSNSNLIEKFGSSAVTNSDSSFVEHFKKIHESKSIYHEWIWNRNMESKFVTPEKKYNLNSISKVKLELGNFIEYLEPNKYDFIQTSNLTDWMNKEEFDNFCLIVKKALKPNGILIMRRLLSNNILETKFPTAIKLNDKTNFYKETICFVNSEK